MQTIVLNIQDSFLEDFLEIVEQYKDKVQIKADKNLMYDPYFYDRKEQLQKDLIDIENGKINMLSQEEYRENLNIFMNKLKVKYAN